MWFDISKMQDWWIPAALAGGGLLIGLVLERFVVKRLKTVAARTSWSGDEIILQAIHGMTLLGCALVGLYAAILQLRIDPLHRARASSALLLIAMAAATIALARIAAGLIRLYAGRVQGVLPSTSLLANLGKIAVFVTGALVICDTFGIRITPIVTALGVGGIAVALALQDTLTNLFAGLQIMASRHVNPGDYVRLDEAHEGHVVDISWRHTTLKSLANNIINIPNSKLASGIVTNFHARDMAVSVSVQVTVAHGGDLEAVERVTEEVARDCQMTVPGSVREFQPQVRFQAVADSGITFSVSLQASTFVDQFLLKHELIKRVNRRYREEGIAVATPIRTVIMGEGAHGREE
ncbi:MAG: mechanosensitive ion channel family protein [Acidobacteria bacterium]|nr:mechanosensitive ion channel family protein [Acidobacteriota bacterium]